MATIDRDLAKYFTITTESIGKDIKKIINERAGGSIVGILKDVYQTPKTIQQVSLAISSADTGSNITPDDAFIVTNAESPLTITGNKVVRPIVISKMIQDKKAKNAVGREIYKTPFMAMFSKSQAVMPGTSNTDLSELYMSSLGGLELSRMFPYLDVRFNIRKGSSGNDILNLPSIIQKDINYAKDNSFAVHLKNASTIDKSKFEFRGGRFVNLSLLDEKSATPLNKKYNEFIAKQSGRGFGMEVFTTPQTMVSDYKKSNMGGSSAVGGLKDPFASFMTLKSFSFSVNAGVSDTPMGRYGMGFVIGKAELKIELHDKSRLRDILSLLRSDGGAYGRSGGTLDIEFGYKHQDEFNINRLNMSPQAELVKASRQKSRFTIISTDFTINQGGSVEIQINLLPDTSHQKLKSLYIGKREDKSHSDAYKSSISKLQAAITAASKTTPDIQDKIKEFGVAKILNIHEKNIEKMSYLDFGTKNFDELFKKAEEQIKKDVRAGDVFNALNVILTKIKTFHTNQTNKGKTKGALRKKQDSSIANIQKILRFKKENEKNVFKSIIDKEQYKYFIENMDVPNKASGNSKDNNRDLQQLVNNINKSQNENYKKFAGEKPASVEATGPKDKSGKKTFSNRDALKQTLLQSVASNLYGAKNSPNHPRYVSFAHVIQKLFVNELLSLKEKENESLNFDEIQLYFYSFNDNCGYMSKKHIGGFLIDYQQLLSQMMREVLITGSTKISLTKSFDIIAKLLRDPSYIMYKELNPDSVKKYQKYQKETTYDSTTGTRKPKKQQKEPPKKENSKDKKTNDNSDFTVPNIQMVIDTHIVKSKGAHASRDTGKKDEVSILRLAIYDKSASLFESEKKLLRNLYSGGSLGFDQDVNKLNKDLKKQIKAQWMPSSKSQKKISVDEKIGAINTHIKKHRDSKHTPDSYSNGYTKIKDEFKKVANAVFGAPGTVLTETRIKTLLKASIPTIHPYAESSLIDNITFKKITNKLVQNALRSEYNRDARGGRTPNAKNTQIELDSNGQIDVKMIGNFYMKAAQEYYFDLETGTEIDNVYRIRGVNHSISDSGIQTTFAATRQGQTYKDLKKAFNGQKDIMESKAAEEYQGVLNNIKRELEEQKKQEEAERKRKAAAYAAHKRRAELKKRKDAIAAGGRAGYEAHRKNLLDSAPADVAKLNELEKLQKTRKLSPSEQKQLNAQTKKVASSIKQVNQPYSKSAEAFVAELAKPKDTSSVNDLPADPNNPYE
jgi:hypothetical protein